jgi:Tol biopolymer transport system component
MPLAAGALLGAKDGRCVAFASNRSGSYEIYVQSFPIAGEPIRISKDGGNQPR